MSTNHFTPSDFDDTIFPTYKTWEEIPVSTLNFANNTQQICYISIPKNQAVNIIKNQAVPVNTKAYEYRENIKKDTNKVILAVEIDTSKGMLDLTNKNEYKTYLISKLNNTEFSLGSNISLLRRINIESNLNHFYIEYIILNNSCIGKIYKIQ